MKKRKDCFLGIHFDFHADPDKSPAVYDTLTEEAIHEVCELYKPDYIQLDSKGHPGWASFPTKFGNTVPTLKGDGIAMFRKVTREHDIPLYMHYSGIYDIKYCNEHPEDCVMRADGSLVRGATRLDGKYMEKQGIPQLLELIENYGVDGVWSDGDCWMAFSDFHPETLAKFEKETGLSLDGTLPAKKGDKYYEEYRNFNRELFRRWLRNYVDTVHEKYPEFQFTSNWSFSDHMPEQPCANLDYVSGDVAPANSFHSARYCGRALAQNGMPWDIITWTFRDRAMKLGTSTPKAPVQVMQEAAEVISLGGGFDMYFHQEPNGDISLEHIRELKSVEKFARAREEFCFKTKAIPQVAMLLSTHDRHLECQSRLYSRDGMPKFIGMTSLLCDAGQSLEIASEFKLEGRYNEYPMIVVPELYEGLENETVEKLLDYARNGGNLVIIGKNACKFFSENGAPFSVNELHERVITEETANFNGHDADVSKIPYQSYYFTTDKTHFGFMICPVEICSDTGDTVAWSSIGHRGEFKPLAKIIPFGNGTITPIGASFGEQYNTTAQYMHINLIKTVADKLYAPLARIESAAGRAEILCTEKNGREFIQIVNANGNHCNPNVLTDDTLPPLIDLKLSIALDKAPKSLILQPEGRELSFEYKDGRAFVDIDRINIHAVLEIVK